MFAALRLSLRWLPSPEPEPKLLSPWPLPRLPNWVEQVNTPLTAAELVAVRPCVQRGQPLGDERTVLGQAFNAASWVVWDASDLRDKASPINPSIHASVTPGVAFSTNSRCVSQLLPCPIAINPWEQIFDTPPAPLQSYLPVHMT